MKLVEELAVHHIFHIDEIDGMFGNIIVNFIQMKIIYDLIILLEINRYMKKSESFNFIR